MLCFTRITCTTNEVLFVNYKHDYFSSEPGPAATMVGNIVMGTRIGGAAGREIADIEEDSDMARKVTFFQTLFINYGEKLSLVVGSSKASVWSIFFDVLQLY